MIHNFENKIEEVNLSIFDSFLEPYIEGIGKDNVDSDLLTYTAIVKWEISCNANEYSMERDIAVSEVTLLVGGELARFNEEDKVEELIDIDEEITVRGDNIKIEFESRDDDESTSETYLVSSIEFYNDTVTVYF